jgi:hypothetical protein
MISPAHPARAVIGQRLVAVGNTPNLGVVVEVPELKVRLPSFSMTRRVIDDVEPALPVGADRRRASSTGSWRTRRITRCVIIASGSGMSRPASAPPQSGHLRRRRQKRLCAACRSLRAGYPARWPMYSRGRDFHPSQRSQQTAVLSLASIAPSENSFVLFALADLGWALGRARASLPILLVRARTKLRRNMDARDDGRYVPTTYCLAKG